MFQKVRVVTSYTFRAVKRYRLTELGRSPEDRPELLTSGFRLSAELSCHCLRYQGITGAKNAQQYLPASQNLAYCPRTSARRKNATLYPKFTPRSSAHVA